MRGRQLPGPKPYYVTHEQPDMWFDAAEVWEIRGADLTISPVHKVTGSETALLLQNSGFHAEHGRIWITLRAWECSAPPEFQSTCLHAEQPSFTRRRLGCCRHRRGGTGRAAGLETTAELCSCVYSGVQCPEVAAASPPISAWCLQAAAGRLHPERGVSLRFPRFIRERTDKVTGNPRPTARSTGAAPGADFFQKEKTKKNVIAPLHGRAQEC